MDEKITNLLRACMKVKEWVEAQDEENLPPEFSDFVEAVDYLLQPIIEGRILVPVVCNCGHALYTVTCNKERYDRWQNGEGNIQDLLPELDAGQREILISGTCGTCFDAIFPSDDSGDDGECDSDEEGCEEGDEGDEGD